METHFPITQDIELAYMLMWDWCNRFFPMIRYKRLLTTVDELDEIHGEIPETKKKWSPEFTVRAFVVPDEVTQPLTGFSLEEARNAELFIAVPSLVEAGLVTMDEETYELTDVGQIGDHFWYHGVEYDITVFKPAVRFGNTDLVLYYQVHGDRYREISADHWTP